MPQKKTTNNTINEYIKAYNYDSIPRADTPTNVLYDEYLEYCTRHQQEPLTKTKFTQTLRLFGYERVTFRIHHVLTKAYRYTGRKPQQCPTCHGKGTIVR